jgi:hypothetical protein
MQHNATQCNTPSGLDWHADTKHFNMTLLDFINYPDMKFTLYTLATLPPGETYALTPGSADAHAYKWAFTGTAMELVYNHGTGLSSTFNLCPLGLFAARALVPCGASSFLQRVGAG